MVIAESGWILWSSCCQDLSDHQSRSHEAHYGNWFGCGSFGVSWLRCEGEAVAVFRVVNAFVLAAEVKAPVGFEVSVGDDGAELEDGLGAFESPSCARYVHSVFPC
jgi:hypothetical protein